MRKICSDNRGHLSYYSSSEGGVSYLRNDASAPKPDTPCSKISDTEWIALEADGSY